ncbi:nucleotidyltransferase [Aquibium carbonis]|uniref:Nucleotidyltransferase n=1 Tax=Aquibium carbonis TaxID=2495581 RepID=A0A429YYB9_9HYPH|nr:nucleotidyltransferase family protein [Aquibium carbonis]RST86423.1 nucleotidyltransferase [Aquibium carbonis]
MRPSEALAIHRDEVLAIIARYPVTNPRVFGSVARGEDVEGSDIDILVENQGRLTFFDIFELEERLCDLLGVPVEVFTKLNDPAARTAASNVRPL